MLKEREEFLAELDKESSSKQDLLNNLQEKMRQQEEICLKEKRELENLLQMETEKLRLAKDKVIIYCYIFYSIKRAEFLIKK